MHWKLCRTALLCSARRLRAALRANPFVGALAVVAALALPLVALVAGRSFAGVVNAAAHDDALAFALALAAGLAATTAGIAVAALAPGRDLLGSQLEPSPLTPLAAWAGLVLLPAAVVGAPLAFLAFVFGVAADGPLLAAHLVVGATAGVASGAAAAEAIVGAARGSRGAVLALAALVGASALVGLAAGNVALGPLAPLASAMRGQSSRALTLAAFAVVAALALWAVAGSRRPPARHIAEAVRLRTPITRRASLASAFATSARLARNAQVRRHVATAFMFALGGAAAARLALGGNGLAGFFAGSVALLAASVLPLVGAALRRDARWLTRPSPTRHRALAAADALAAVGVGAIVMGIVLLAAAAFGPLGGGGYFLFATSGLVVLGAAAATGAVLPWHPHRVIEQLASYALLSIVFGALAVTLGRATEAADAVRLSEAAFASIASVLVLAGGVGVAAALEE